MVVYLDQVVLLNGLLDYLLLLTCGRVTASPIRRSRVALAGLLGGLYGAVSLVLPRLGTLPWQLLMGVVLCLAAYGPDRLLLRRSVVLGLLAAAFSGIVLLLTELFSAPMALVGRRVYYPVTFGVLVLTGGGAYGLMKWALGRLEHQGGDIVSVRVTLESQTAVLTALRDTGNTLRDPVSGWPVMVCDGALLKKLLPELKDADLKDPMALLQRVQKTAPGTRPRLVPYKAVGVESGLLLALRPREVQIGGKEERVLLAFTPGSVSDGGGYQALLGGVS